MASWTWFQVRYAMSFSRSVTSHRARYLLGRCYYYSKSPQPGKAGTNRWDEAYRRKWAFGGTPSEIWKQAGRTEELKVDVRVEAVFCPTIHHLRYRPAVGHLGQPRLILDLLQRLKSRDQIVPQDRSTQQAGGRTIGQWQPATAEERAQLPPLFLVWGREGWARTFHIIIIIIQDETYLASGGRRSSSSLSEGRAVHCTPRPVTP